MKYKPTKEIWVMVRVPLDDINVEYHKDSYLDDWGQRVCEVQVSQISLKRMPNYYIEDYDGDALAEHLIEDYDRDELPF